MFQYIPNQQDKIPEKLTQKTAESLSPVNLGAKLATVQEKAHSSSDQQEKETSFKYYK